MKRRALLKAGLIAGASAPLLASGFSNAHETQADSSKPPAEDHRGYWLSQMQRVCFPVLSALSQDKLVATMPVEAAAGHEQDRRKVTHLEAFARTLAGIAPWLEHGPTSGTEGALREQFCVMARQALANGVNQQAADYLRFGEQSQTIVDAGFLSLAIARAPRELREKLPGPVRAQLAEALRRTRNLLAPFNNWLLFAAMVEACLYQLGETWDRARVDYALREHESWFLGDGVYGDGPHLHADYYNSFVIQPFLLALTDVLAAQQPSWAAMVPAIQARAQRYATIQERQIAPDGTYPIVGRSIAYRCGAFQLLAEVALRRSLSQQLSPEQVRCALTTVIHRTLTPKDTFDSAGWLRIGLAGHQPSLGETYISTGSLYLCTAVFLPLGLPAEDRFWSGQAKLWSSQQLWQGVDLLADHAQD